MRILAVGAHPDDLEILCAGTLARCAERGDTVFMAVSTDGAGGSTTLPEHEISCLRQAEACASAAVIGAQPIWLGFPERHLYDNDQTRQRYIELVRETRPDVIITHDPVNDYHPDHLATGQILRSIRVMVVQQNIQSQHPPLETVPDLHFMDTIAGINFVPQTYVDISATMALKRQMLSAHQSQLKLMQQRYGLTLLEFMEICSAFRGLQASVRYAEAFRQSTTFPAEYHSRLP
ncbi:MAG: PIG-L family deacetylase [Acidimicrobiia bacterium]|nr:PIG-L family deacetylase [Acidimicrobiia bacterium]